MEQITNTSYIFTKEPVNFQFRHLEDAVLSVATHYRFINMQPHGDGIDLEFDGGSLSLTQKVRKFCFRWQGGGDRGPNSHRRSLVRVGRVGQPTLEPGRDHAPAQRSADC